MKDPGNPLDQLLNEALATYADVEPRGGLGERVLRHARTTPAARRQWWPWAAIAIPLLATLWLLSVNRQVPVQVPVEPARVLPAPAPVIARAVPPPVRTRPQPATRRLDRFPRDLPLSSGERALVTLATRYPQQARQLTESIDPGPIAPIEIPKIQIPPLTGDIDE